MGSSSREVGGEQAVTHESAATGETVHEASSDGAGAVLTEGQELDRFIIRGVAGRGGMGTVYEAYDPALDRRVALKLVSTKKTAVENTDMAQQRLLREAQAMAKLSHPNVVTVHDVGVVDADIYIAMEFVGGKTLREWRGSENRSWREILEVYVQAGRGLAAAHEAGIVHRDFKPSNVIVNGNGNVQVTDFGLARRDAASALDSGPSGPVTDSEDDLAPGNLTRTGVAMGTPAYMSPEQHAGQPLDARSDQFSFCVALYEALFETRPFPGVRPREIARAVTRGRVLPPPRKNPVPPRVRRAIMRGLSLRPDDRFENMEALLAALHVDRTRRLVWGGIGASLVGIAAASVIGFGLGQRDDPSWCDETSTRIEESWGPERQARVRTAFEALDEAHAARVLQRTSAALDAFGEQWNATHAEICKRMEDQPPDALDYASIECLNQSYEALRVLSDLLVEADESVLGHAADLVESLPTVSACRDPEALRHFPLPPPDVGTARDVARIRGLLAEAQGLRELGHHADALELARPALEAASQTGYPAVNAEASYLIGDLYLRLTEFDTAQEHLYDALKQAELAGHGVVKANAYSDLVWVAIRQRRLDEAGRLWKQLDASVEAIGDPPRQRIAALGAAAAISRHGGDNDRALEMHEAALSLRESTLGLDSAAAVMNLVNVGVVHGERGRYRVAKDYLLRAVAVIDRIDHRDRPAAAFAFQTLGGICGLLGEYDEAEKYFNAALVAHEASGGVDNPRTEFVYAGLSDIAMRRGELEEALRLRQRVLEIHEGGSATATWVGANWKASLAEVLAKLGRHEEALRHLEEAVPLAQSRKLAHDPELAGIYAFMASSLHAMGDDELAAQRINQAAALVEEPSLDPVATARARITVAEVVRELGGNEERVLELARSAGEIHDPPLPPPLQQRIDDFIATSSEQN